MKLLPLSPPRVGVVELYGGRLTVLAQNRDPQAHQLDVVPIEGGDGATQGTATSGEHRLIAGAHFQLLNGPPSITIDGQPFTCGFLPSSFKCMDCRVDLENFGDCGTAPVDSSRPRARNEFATLLFFYENSGRRRADA